MILRRVAVPLLAAAALAAVLACSKKEGAGGPGPATELPSTAAATAQAIAPSTGAAPAADDPAAYKKDADEIFATRCTPCHGSTGGGDGPASKGLTPPPRNFHDGTWQGQVTDEHIETIIQFGGAAVGKSPAMPPNPDLVDKPVVKALRAHIRSLKQ